MIKRILNATLTDAGENWSFEFSEWNLSAPNRAIMIIAVYRPPNSEALSVTANMFLDEFANYLENFVMSPEILIITGDFNFLLHDSTNSDANFYGTAGNFWSATKYQSANSCIRTHSRSSDKEIIKWHLYLFHTRLKSAHVWSLLCSWQVFHPTASFVSGESG